MTSTSFFLSLFLFLFQFHFYLFIIISFSLKNFISTISFHPRISFVQISLSLLPALWLPVACMVYSVGIQFRFVEFSSFWFVSWKWRRPRRRKRATKGIRRMLWCRSERIGCLKGRMSWKTSFNSWRKWSASKSLPSIDWRKSWATYETNPLCWKVSGRGVWIRKKTGSKSWKKLSGKVFASQLIVKWPSTLRLNSGRSSTKRFSLLLFVKDVALLFLIAISYSPVYNILDFFHPSCSGGAARAAIAVDA